MQDRLNSPYIRPFSIAASLVLLSLVSAQGAITLTFDAAAKTFIWSGSATSISFEIPFNEMQDYRFGTGTWIGGFIVSTGADVTRPSEPVS